VLWPPQLDDLKAELNRPRTDTADDAQLQSTLDAAVATVERERYGDLNFVGATTGATALLPVPSADVVTGTLRLAVRWWHRKRSPEGFVDLGEFGHSRVPRFDTDIDRLLGVGSYRIPMV
jgi:hypothetical protein